MTGRMRQTLTQAARQPLRRVHDQPRNAPPPPWPAPPQTLHALHARGLVEHTRRRNRRGWPVDEWAITAQGRQALQPHHTIRRDRPMYLADRRRGAAHGDYTPRPDLAIDTIEILPDPHPAWAADSNQRWHAAQDPRRHGHRLALAAKREPA